ncbi:hypothetical protein MAUB1S_07307 [Mycolicibacterium aubagnense]
MTIEIRRLLPGDDAVLDHVAEEVFDDPVEPARLKAYLAAPNHLMFVALLDGMVVGQCAAVVHRHPDKPVELYIDEVGVSPSFQRQGVARRMLAAMFALGREFGCGEAWVGTEPDNIAARALYENLAESPDPAEGFVMYVYKL